MKRNSFLGAQSQCEEDGYDEDNVMALRREIADNG